MRSAKGLPFLLSEGMKVYFVPPQLDAPREASVVSVQSDSSDSYLVHFDTVNDIDTATLLSGSWCLVDADDVPEEVFDETGLALSDYQVFDQHQGYIGRVIEVIENPAQSLLSVELDESALNEEWLELVQVRNKRPVLIPYVEAFILEVNHYSASVTVDIPRGLLDL